jgi:hypothetical protein
MKHPIPYMFTSQEQWAEPSVNSMIGQMRLAYQDYQGQKLRKVKGLEKFDYSVIGPQLKELLTQILETK